MASMLHSLNPHKPAKTPSSLSLMAATFQSHWPTRAHCQRKQSMQLGEKGWWEVGEGGKSDDTFFRAAFQPARIKLNTDAESLIWWGIQSHLPLNKLILAHSAKCTSSFLLNTTRIGSSLLFQMPVALLNSSKFQKVLPNVEQGCVTHSPYSSLVDTQYNA